jgi:hypothetical protein
VMASGVVVKAERNVPRTAVTSAATTAVILEFIFR